MIKHEIEFENLEGEKIKKTFHFHISQAELTEWRLELDEGLEKRLEELNASTKVDAKVIAAFKEIISRAVGVTSEDGIRFIKTPEIRDGFMQSDAYSVLFMQLVTDTAFAAKFVSGVVPKSMGEKTATAIAQVTKAVELPQEQPKTVALPAQPAPTPNFLTMKPEEFAAWQQRQSSPLGA